jgi:hypothetical protein
MSQPGVGALYVHAKPFAIIWPRDAVGAGAGGVLRLLHTNANTSRSHYNALFTVELAMRLEGKNPYRNKAASAGCGFSKIFVVVCAMTQNFFIPVPPELATWKSSRSYLPIER